MFDVSSVKEIMFSVLFELIAELFFFFFNEQWDKCLVFGAYLDSCDNIEYVLDGKILFCCLFS